MIRVSSLIAVLLISFGFTTGLNNQSTHLQWKHWNDGFLLAKTSQKIALIDAYTDWCGWCKKMDKATYEDSTIIAKINANFIPIKFNPELSDLYHLGDTMVSGRHLLAALSDGKSTGYPTTFFYLPSKNQMMSFPGYMDAQRFGELLDNLVAFEKSSQP